MSDPPTRFHQLIRQVQQGSPEAAQELADTYGPQVRRFVRRSLTRELRVQYDSLDFVQLVWASFFCQPQALPPIETPSQLVGYLAGMAQHKVVDEDRRQHALKNNVNREERIDRHPGAAGPSVFSRDPTPSAVAIFREEWDSLVTRQPDDVGKVVQRRFEGATYREIAEELNICERTARRTIARLERDRDPNAAANSESADLESADREEPSSGNPANV